MNRLKNLMLIALVCAVLALSACQADSDTGKDKEEDTAPVQTAAGKYLAETSDEEIFDYFMNAYYAMTGEETGFTSPEDLDTNELFRIAATSDLGIQYEDEWYDENDQMFYIPLADLQSILDTYFESYHFVPDALTYAEYDPETETFITPALGFGFGASDPSFYSAEAIDEDTVKVELEDRYSNNTVITARVTDDGVRFLTCTRMDYTTKDASEKIN